MKRCLVPILGTLILAVLLAPAATAQDNQLDASERIFTVLAAVNAAGYDADPLSGANHPLRMAVRKEIERRNPEVLADLRSFLKQHQRRDWSSELSQYISFALSLTPPPSFELRYDQNEMPLDALQLAGLEHLIREFYVQADIPTLWRQAQPAIEKELERYQPDVVKAIQEVDGYLQNTGFLGHRFQIYLDFMGAPRQAHTRSYGKEFFLVLTHFPEPPIEHIRHAYLQFALDPIVIQYTNEIKQRQALEDYAKGAALLPEQYKDDFVLLTMNSLAKAVEARLAPTPREEGLVREALEQGYILTPYFYEALQAYEKGDQSMRFYFPEMLKGLSVEKEARRLEAVVFRDNPGEAPARPVPVSEEQRERTLKRLDEAEELYTKKNYAAAKPIFQEIAESEADRSVQARGLYGLARIAALERDPETAEQLFQQALTLSPDPTTASWAEVYLGRLAEVRNDSEESARRYRNALAVRGGSEKAREAARQALAKQSTN